MKYQIGDIINDLTVEYISEFDNGYSRELSYRITLKDSYNTRFTWETSSKKIPRVGDVISGFLVKYVGKDGHTYLKRKPSKS